MTGQNWKRTRTDFELPLLLLLSPLPLLLSAGLLFLLLLFVGVGVVLVFVCAEEVTDVIWVAVAEDGVCVAFGLGKSYGIVWDEVVFEVVAVLGHYDKESGLGGIWMRVSGSSKGTASKKSGERGTGPGTRNPNGVGFIYGR